MKTIRQRISRRILYIAALSAPVLIAQGLAALALPVRPVSTGRGFFSVEWVAVSLAGKPFAAEALPTFHIDRDGRYGGFGGCNRYGGSAVVDGAKLKMGNAFSTKMFCVGAGSDNEMRFLAALRTVTGWQMPGRELTLESAQGPLVFRRK